MKRTVFVSTGAALLLIVFSLWVYLLLFGAPKQMNELFANIGLTTPATPIESVPSVPLASTAQLNITDASLAQLTTRPVAGFGFITSSTTDRILYAEKGTGHVYEIDLATGIENRVLAKTSLLVTDAIFSPDGTLAVLTLESGDRAQAVLETIGTTRTGYRLPEAATNLHFLSSDRLAYTINDASGSTGYVYDFAAAQTDQVFTVPLTDINVHWGDSETLIYSRPAARLSGTLYRANGTSLNRIGAPGYAFSALVPKSVTGTYVLTRAETESNQLVSSVVVEASTASPARRLALTALPDKCAFATNDPNRLWCASPVDTMQRPDQNNWYMGTKSFADSLWVIDMNDGSATFWLDLTAMSGRELDVTNLMIDSTNRYLLFKNKHDDTLWLSRLNSTTN